MSLGPDPNVVPTTAAGVAQSAAAQSAATVREATIGSAVIRAGSGAPPASLPPTVLFWIDQAGHIAYARGDAGFFALN